jgi:hypothetical protein
VAPPRSTAKRSSEKALLALPVAETGHGQGTCRKPLHDLAEARNHAAIITVCDLAHHKRQKKQRQELREPD